MSGGERWSDRAVFPFTALAGQDEAKLALTLAVICPALGGVLLRGEKGTAKSTLARGLAALLPDAGFAGGFVDVPLTVGEDRLAGCIDLEQAVAAGRIVCQPGLLSQADGGVLYVDEVNLLPDHITDMLLGVAASGRFRLEREGLSAEVPSRFVFVGSMNPEEGDLRPQLLDRFGLCVDMAAIRNVAGRVRLLRELEAFEADPRAFLAAKFQAREAFVHRLTRAVSLFPVIGLTEPAREKIVELVAAAACAGQRAEILLSRAARAYAAWEKKPDADPAAVEAVAELVLRHRRREVQPPEQPQEQTSPPERNDQSEQLQPESPSEQESSAHETGQGQAQDQSSEPDQSQPEDGSEGQADALPSGGKETVFAVGDPVTLTPIRFRRDRLRRKLGSGRRTPTKTLARQGRTVGSRMSDEVHDLALDATLRAAAPHQSTRKADHPDGPAVRIRPCDLRERVREKRLGTLLVLVADASASMGASRRMSEAKGAILSFLLDAYQKRDRVAFVTFRGTDAQVVLPPTGSLERASRLLEDLPTGGKTPLTHGLCAGYQIIENALRLEPSTIPWLVVVTDGRVNVPYETGQGRPLGQCLAMAERIAADTRIHSLVVDMEPEHANALGLAGDLASAMGARAVRAQDLGGKQSNWLRQVAG